MNQAYNGIKKGGNRIFNNSKLLIDRNIYNFLFKLLYCIFIKSNKQKIKEKIQIHIDKINKYYIKIKDEKINYEYSTKNLINIVKFVKQQNDLYAGEIIENILIIIFSFAFKTGKENTFGKYLYCNILKLKNINNNQLIDWFDTNKLNKEIKSLSKLLGNENDMERKKTNKIPDKPIFKLLLEIYEEKYNRKKKRKNNELFK